MASPYTALTRADPQPLASDEEEDVTFLTLELGAVDPALIPSCSSIRLVGLETSTPFLQLGDLVFQGIHAPSLGTELVFQNNDAAPVITTEHKILFNPVALTPRTVAEPDSVPPSAPPESREPEEAAGGSAPQQRQPAPARRAGRPRGGRGRHRQPASETR